MTKEAQTLIVVAVENEDKALNISVCPEDYSKLYTLTLYKEDYDKTTKKWSVTDEVTKRYEDELEKLGGVPKAGDKIDVYPSDNGKAYLQPSTFIKAEKPTGKMVGKLLLGCEVESIRDNVKGRTVTVSYKGKFYEFSFNTSVWIPTIGKYVPNDAKANKARERFEDIFEESPITWDNALVQNEDGEFLAKGVKINCMVRKNELDQTGNSGYLEPSKIEADEGELPF